MKVVKWLLVAVVALLLAAVASTFFMSENFRISQTQVIKASPEAVFNQINTLKNWKNWSYWQNQDVKMEITYNDIPAGVGASYSWKSDKKEMGNGSLTLSESNPDAYLQCKLVFEGYGESWSEYILKPVEGGTELTSAMNSPTKGVFAKLMGRIMMKPMMMKAFRASADKLDSYLQANPDAAKPTITDSATIKIPVPVKDCTVTPKK